MSNDIDPDRKFSNGTVWDNSIDWDDASDGSDGGYDRHGSPINANAMKELVQLRMETSRLRIENEELREALKPLAKAIKGQIADILFGEMPDNSTATVILQLGDLRRARAALEGVTEPPR